MKPTSKSVLFTLKDKKGNDVESFIDTFIYNPGNNLSFRFGVMMGGKWTLLASPDIFERDIKTKESCYAVIEKALAEINSEIKKAFGVGSIQESGLDFINWVLSNELTEKDNELKVNKNVNE